MEQARAFWVLAVIILFGCFNIWVLTDAESWHKSSFRFMTSVTRASARKGLSAGSCVEIQGLNKQVDDRQPNELDEETRGDELVKCQTRLQSWEEAQDNWWLDIEHMLSRKVLPMQVDTFITTFPRKNAEQRLRTTLNSLLGSGWKHVIIAYGQPPDHEMAYIASVIRDFAGSMNIVVDPMPLDLWKSVENVTWPSLRVRQLARVNANVFRMYKALQSTGKYVLHLQDDIMTASYFAIRLQVLLQDLSKLDIEGKRIVTLYVPYWLDHEPEVSPNVVRFPNAENFYGSQALLYSPMLMSTGALAQWIFERAMFNISNVYGHDHHLKEFVIANKDVGLFATKSSYVQHLGYHSTIEENDKRFHQVGKGETQGYYVDDRRSQFDRRR